MTKVKLNGTIYRNTDGENVYVAVDADGNYNCGAVKVVDGEAVKRNLVTKIAEEAIAFMGTIVEA